MTVNECYAAFNGDYEDALGRLRKDERIVKYLKMFAAGEDFSQLFAAVSEERWEDAFRSVHNLKGVSLNLGLTPMHVASDVLCETIRHGKPDCDISGMLEDVKTAYNSIVSAIAKLD